MLIWEPIWYIQTEFFFLDWNILPCLANCLVFYDFF